MKSSYKLGEFFGIAVKLHVTFLFLLGWVALSTLWGGGLGEMLVNSFFVVAVFGFVVMHEYGHALTARAFGIRTREITLYPIGGVAMLERMPKSPRQQLLVALAGPAVNFVLAGVFALLMALSGSSPGSFGFAPGTSLVTSLLSALFWVNVLMGGFNLLPALPMDGGRVLRAVLEMRVGPLRATEIAAKVAKVVAVGMALYALLQGHLMLLQGHLMLLAIAAFVWFMAGAERRAARFTHGDGDGTLYTRAYPTDAFRRPPGHESYDDIFSNLRSHSGPRAGHTARVVDDDGSLDPAAGARPTGLGRGFVLSVVQTPDGRRFHVVRVRR